MPVVGSRNYNGVNILPVDNFSKVLVDFAITVPISLINENLGFVGSAELAVAHREYTRVLEL
jgi:hypothetical protein